MKKKTIALIVCLTLIIGCAIGGTIAWLTAQTDSVTNTFTVGNVDITLAETTSDYKMVPGNKIAKDPIVSVEADSEACWLFVKVEAPAFTANGKSYALTDFITYSVDTAVWTALGDGYPGVYYREVDAATAKTGASYTVLTKEGTDAYKNGYVMVNTTVTKAMMEDLQADGAKLPQLTFTAYACQKDNVNTAAEAWAKLNP